jgi:hypothetical protein
MAIGNFDFVCIPDTLAENAFVEVLKDAVWHFRRSRSQDTEAHS